MIDPQVKKLLESKFGKRIRYPKDCEALAVQINAAINQSISASTLKRIFGFIQPSSKPSLFTLDTIALFLGYEDWNVLSEALFIPEDSIINPNESVDCSSLEKDSIWEFIYGTNKSFKLKYIDNCNFVVINSRNSSLEIGDVLQIKSFGNGFPLVAKQVIRKGDNLGSYVAGKRGGIRYIRPLED